ncbi:glycosyltransferase family 4 protein [Comamonas flocculans]|uniref:Glycosyltransferase family 4 protein n=1 Tax=Comamonas flocculans TaxID=2597701 RepID=A0A5B8RUX9_9BURK|nr:glycosyltransferase family 4 protein [Comamonas flocculans]QEA12484.1 glycosyltransferase family 4 protein [Comamonas flocculans]
MAHSVLTAINVPDLSPVDDAFTQLQTRHVLRWVGLSGQPANALERRIWGVRLSRYRAAAQAALRAGPRSFVISHLPLMTAAVAHLLRLRGDVPHLGFAFNFTRLPTGRRLQYLRGALRRVDKMVVFSRYEQGLYAEHFGIERERFQPVIWTQEPPPVQAETGLGDVRPYLCAIGDEGRDFALLMQVARRLGPTTKMVVVARSQSLTGMEVPENVTVLTNISLARTWAIANGSCGVLVPLLSRETCCGHITLVGAKLLGLPLATTRTHAAHEYVEGRAAVLLCEPGDVAEFTLHAQRMIDDAQIMRSLAKSQVARETAIHDRKHWASCLDAFIECQVVGSVE